jgi:hypothetical protein
MNYKSRKFYFSNVVGQVLLGTESASSERGVGQLFLVTGFILSEKGLDQGLL